MKIIHIITNLGLGGAERMLHRVLTAENALKHEQIVVSLKDEGIYGPKLEKCGIKVICLNMKNGVPSISALLKLISLLRSQNADVIMSWLYHADLMGVLAALLGGARIKKLVWNLRCSNIDFEKYSFSTKVTVSLLSFFSKFINTIVFNSYAGKNLHIELGYSPKRWKYIPNGFDLNECSKKLYDRETVREELGINKDTLLFGMIGRYDPQKDHQNFLAAAKILISRIENLHFVLIGPDIEKLKVPLELKDKVSLFGRRLDIPRFLSALDVNVLSSSYGEGFPNVVGEAMAMEVPSIVTDVGDSAELVGETGLIVPPKDAEALFKAMLKISQTPPTERKLLGKLAREKIIKNYNIEDIENLYIEEWQSIHDSIKV
jgi:glycosyltransferase involved in cell wall biosynthesis